MYQHRSCFLSWAHSTAIATAWSAGACLFASNAWSMVLQKFASCTICLSQSVPMLHLAGIDLHTGQLQRCLHKQMHCQWSAKGVGHTDCFWLEALEVGKTFNCIVRFCNVAFSHRQCHSNATCWQNICHTVQWRIQMMRVTANEHRWSSNERSFASNCMQYQAQYCAMQQACLWRSISKPRQRYKDNAAYLCKGSNVDCLLAFPLCVCVCKRKVEHRYASHYFWEPYSSQMQHTIIKLQALHSAGHVCCGLRICRSKTFLQCPQHHPKNCFGV